MTLQIINHGIVINQFISENGQDSNWKVRIENHPTIPNVSFVNLHWHDKVEPTHSTCVPTDELKTLIKVL